MSEFQIDNCFIDITFFRTREYPIIHIEKGDKRTLVEKTWINLGWLKVDAMQLGRKVFEPDTTRLFLTI